MTGLRHRAEEYFEFKALGTTWRTEVLAGVTTFMTMAYIIFVNPSILHDAGVPAGAAAVATCLAAGFGSLMMGAFARYPIALAPGMGLNAYFTYSVVNGMGVHWETALGAVFLSGISFLVLTAVGVRQLIVEAIPQQLCSAVACGVGLFIALIGLRNSGVVVPNPSTMVSIGNLREPSTLLALGGLLLITCLTAWRIKASILIGVVATTLCGFAAGLVHWHRQMRMISDIKYTAFHLDISGAVRLGVLEIVFVFLFVDLLDNVGTLVAVSQKAGLTQAGGYIPRLNRILLSDASATIFGSLAGTSTVVSYIESSAGVAAGGRTGVTAVVTGLLFLLALGVAPLGGVIPSFATGPALIAVGCLMMPAATEIDWMDFTIALPAFLTMVTIPLTYSIANGLALGFSSYTLIRVATGRFREVKWFMYLLTGLFLLRFYYMGKNG
jgi:adenine/guanine/hypoxanthine permease